MNSGKRRAIALSYAIAAFVLTAAWALIAGTGAVGGANLTILSGARPDYHFLTAALFVPIARGMAAHQPVFNGVAIALLASFGTYVLVYRRRGQADPLGLLLALSLALSPLALAIISDPLGIEAVISIAFIVLLLADVASLIRVPPPLRIVVVACLPLQDTLFVPVAVAYAIWCYAHGVRVNWGRATLAVGCIAAVVSLVLAHYELRFSYAVNPAAAPRTAIFAALLIFIALPALCWYTPPEADAKRKAVDARSFMMCVVAGLALMASIYATSGEPAPYFLAAQVAVVFAVAIRLRKKALIQYATLALCLLLVIILEGRLCSVPAIAQTTQSAHEIAQIRTILRDHPAERMCLYGNASDGQALFAARSIGAVYPAIEKRVVYSANISACTSSGTTTRLASVEHGAVVDFGLGGGALVNAMTEGSTAQTELWGKRFEIAPDRRTTLPGGHGAFADQSDAPLGTAHEITIAAPFSVSYRCLSWPHGAALSFAAANPLGAQAHVGTVELVISAGNRPLAIETMRPTPGASHIRWRYYRVPLRLAARCERLTFSVKAGGVNGSGTWASIAEPAIVSAGH